MLIDLDVEDVKIIKWLILVIRKQPSLLIIQIKLL
jgi:hypothetical protein